MRTRSKAVLACWLVLAVFVAGICLVLGGIDDAPGLGGLGLLAALAMILAAASRWGVMARGTAVALFTGICWRWRGRLCSGLTARSLAPVQVYL